MSDIDHKERLAYLAGLFDGEGSFTINVNTKFQGKLRLIFSPRMSVSLRYGGKVLKQFKQEFGGSVYRVRSSGKLFTMWHLGKREQLVAATKALLPFLHIKKEIAERFLEALDLFPGHRAKNWQGKRSWTLENAKQVALKDVEEAYNASEVH